MTQKSSHSKHFIEWTIIWIDIAKSSFEKDMQQVEESIKQRYDKIRQDAIEEYKLWLIDKFNEKIEDSQDIWESFYLSWITEWLCDWKKIIEYYNLPIK